MNLTYMSKPGHEAVLAKAAEASRDAAMEPTPHKHKEAAQAHLDAAACCPDKAAYHNAMAGKHAQAAHTTANQIRANKGDKYTRNDAGAFHPEKLK